MPSANIASVRSGIALSWSENNKTGEKSPVSVVLTPEWDVYIMTRGSQSTPGYKSGLRRKTIRRGGLPMNPFSYTKHQYKGPVGHQNTRVVDTSPQTYSDITYHLEGQLRENNDQLNVTRPTGAEINALDAKVRTNTLLEMKDQKTNLMQVYAERHQTERLFGETARRVVGGLTALKSGNLAGAYRALGLSSTPRKNRKYKKRFGKDPDKAISNAWLELQYGWRPLLDDVYGSAELIAQANLREVRTRSRRSSSIEAIWDVVSVNAPTAYGTNHMSYKYTIAYTVYYSTSNELIKTLSQVGVTNPGLIVWELTPWSFVIDWMLPIGNYLNSLNATSGYVFEKGCKTTFFRYFQRNNLRGGRSGSATSFTEVDTMRTSSREYIECNRSTLASWPRTSLPSFKNPFSGEHLANALGLLNQLSHRRNPRQGF